uniref:Uncharacterized protein n=1 Tax=Leersia perrieri TaxID=77586 RepID=A0A0D9WXI4_9ORYZ
MEHAAWPADQRSGDDGAGSATCGFGRQIGDIRIGGATRGIGNRRISDLRIGGAACEIGDLRRKVGGRPRRRGGDGKGGHQREERWVVRFAGREGIRAVERRNRRRMGPWRRRMGPRQRR